MGAEHHGVHSSAVQHRKQSNIKNEMATLPQAGRVSLELLLPLRQLTISITCTQGLWAEEESWWPAYIHAVLPKGYLELRVEPTAMHPEVPTPADPTNQKGPSSRCVCQGHVVRS